jgi:hypothetical protein
MLLVRTKRVDRQHRRSRETRLLSTLQLGASDRFVYVVEADGRETTHDGPSLDDRVRGEQCNDVI